MGPSHQYVIFTLDEQRYALPLQAIMRITSAVYVTPLPHAPAIVSGVITVQGTVVPVVNLRRRFQLAARTLDPADQFILAQTPRRTVALIVDAVLGVQTVSTQFITPGENFFSTMNHVGGVISQADGIMFIYNLEACLSYDEEHTLDVALQAA